MFIILSVAMGIGYTSCKKENSVKPASVHDAGTGTSTRGDEEGVFIRGHVKNTSGTGIAAATVKLTPAGSVIPLQSVSADASGEYSLAKAPRGIYQLQLSASGYITESSTITVSDDVIYTDTLLTN